MGSNLTDDEKYLKLYAKYKELRRQQGKEASKYLQAAMKLRESGNVSQDAIIGAAYL